jgi:glycine dehydrogenase
VKNLIEQTIPAGIRLPGPLNLPPARSEAEVLVELRSLADENQVFRSFLGQGYSGTHTPGVLQRGILENPGWYTAYTPYQAEISQGRLEALVNFQTLICDLTGMDLAGASLLDEATAAAEAMTLCWRSRPRGSAAKVFFVSRDCHPQVIDVVRTRAEPLGFTVVVGDADAYDFAEPTFGVLVSYPDTRGRIVDPTQFIARAHGAGARAVVSADLLALTLLKTPGQCGADVTVGTSQRFGVPLGFGGPHAGYLAVKEPLKRELPGRLVGVSKDANGNPAYRLALQTREQHIRREGATSNICTAQVLLAVLASMYAVYHGPGGLVKIARRLKAQAQALAEVLGEAGWKLEPGPRFDTLVVTNLRPSDRIVEEARNRRINLRPLAEGAVGISLDETVTDGDLTDLAAVFGLKVTDWARRIQDADGAYPVDLARTAAMLTHPVFHSYHTETEMMRYLHRLQAKDYSLVHGMIPLGSCTMKVNPAAAMFPITWPGFADLHPWAPLDQARGYLKLFERLESWLAEITGLAAVSLQPNSGAQGEYAGLLAIRAWHRSRGQGHRHICLIPTSAHGTNPASAALAGMKVVPVQCDQAGNVDHDDLAARIAEHRENLAALMVTYPSTHGVFEPGIVDLCQAVHEAGGQVYMDGANLNAQVGLTSPGFIGADVCHLNLHKTFSIPHGGGGPGVGPVAVAEHLVPFLPPKVGPGKVSAAPWGSAGILPIPYVAIALLGAEGLTQGSERAISQANVVADRLEPHYPVLYRGAQGRVAHECILDLRPLKASAGIEAEDVAKRLMDYGFHAPTLSFPVPGTLMVEPTESEPRAEVDRFCEAMIAIRQEIRDIEEGRADRTRNLLKDAPFPVEVVTADVWDRPYTREQAAWPVPSLRGHKFWPAVGRVDNVWGDRNLFCSCVPLLEPSSPESPFSSL